MDQITVNGCTMFVPFGYAWDDSGWLYTPDGGAFAPSVLVDMVANGIYVI